MKKYLLLFTIFISNCLQANEITKDMKEYHCKVLRAYAEMAIGYRMDHHKSFDETSEKLTTKINKSYLNDGYPELFVNELVKQVREIVKAAYKTEIKPTSKGSKGSYEDRKFNARAAYNFRDTAEQICMDTLDPKHLNLNNN